MSVLDSFRLDGRTALVTGAGRGLGRAIALALAEAGARVIAVARTEADLDALAAESDAVTPWVADVSDPAFYARIEALETLDVLVNNAGINRPQPVEAVSDDNLDLMLDLNVRALFKTAQAATRVMQRAARGGSIVNMSSQMGHIGSPGRTVYCLTKHAVEGLTKAMAVELAEAGIRVNTVAPTFVETPLTKPMLDKPEFRDWVMGMIPMKRLATQDDIAAATLYLASPASGSVTGTSLLVDGGWTAR
ncbi:MAG: SDR family NAD(P)-dependent oxidoreductase [Pseudomonadota bacterium]